jgi:carnitine O-acetyltransferase
MIDALDDLARLQDTPLSSSELAELSAALAPSYEHLSQHFDAQPGGWAAPAMKFGYMAYRESLAFASNCIRVLERDPREPPALVRAVLLIQAAYRFFGAVSEGTLTPDTQREQPLEMALFRNLFGATRRPQQGIDDQRLPAEDLAMQRPHFIVFCHRGRLFEVALHQATDQGFRLLDAAELWGSLQTCVDTAAYSPPIQLGTSLPRQQWAQWRQQLEQQAHNRESFAAIERALFVVALDDETPTSLNELIQLARDSRQDNRYFDKSLQLLLSLSGDAAMNYEHSFVDGANANRFCSDLYRWSQELPIPVAPRAVGSPRLLGWQLEESDRASLQRASQYVAEQRQRFLAHMFTDDLPGLGSGSFARLGIPDDTLMQLALQLVSRRLFQRVLPMNEAIQMRHFRLGRYDTILGVTWETRAFAEQWDTLPPASAERTECLLRAAQSFRQRVKACKEGRGGVLSLTTLLQLRSEQERLGLVHDGFCLAEFWKSHPAIEEGLYCRLITSNPGPVPGVQMPAFPDVGDRIDVMYLFFQDRLRVHASFHGQYTSAMAGFRELLPTVLFELRDFLSQHGQPMAEQGAV